MGKEFTVEQMQELMACIHKNEIGEFLYETEGVRLRIRGKQEQPAQMVSAPSVQNTTSIAQTSVSAEVQTMETAVCVQEPAAEKSERFITSPIVGTFYAASAPDKPPFAQIGQQLNEGDVAFIVESMKVMNEVTADQNGIVAEVLVQNGDPVEYGQPILRLQ